MNKEEIIKEDGIYEKYRKRVELLTGDIWCPYPSEMFMLAILKTSDKKAIELINLRRKMFAPQFWSGEPQEKELKEILTTP
jgi:hypothetical protein